MIGTDLLNDLFTNNIDFVAKQLQTIVDALFPNNADNSETPVNSSDLPIILSGQIKTYSPEYRYNNTWYTTWYYYNVNYSSLSYDNSLIFLGLDSDIVIPEQVSVNYTPEMVYFKNNPDDPVVSLYSDNRGSYRLRNSSNADAKALWGGQYGVNKIVEKNSSGVIVNNNDYQSLYTANANYTLSFLPQSKSIIVSDNIAASQYYYNNNINFNNDYHNSYTFQVGGGSNNGGGDIFVGGGAGGFVVGLAGAVGYADVDLALDSLIDDLNLNFSNADNKYPVSEFPSYNDIKYEDMGSFYITPVQQIDALPTAPDVGDTVPDISDYLAIVGGAVNSFYNMVDGLGVSLMLVFTFLLCLVINHLKKE